jgi:hypothetical protein
MGPTVPAGTMTAESEVPFDVLAERYAEDSDSNSSQIDAQTLQMGPMGELPVQGI